MFFYHGLYITQYPPEVTRQDPETYRSESVTLRPLESKCERYRCLFCIAVRRGDLNYTYKLHRCRCISCTGDDQSSCAAIVVMPQFSALYTAPLIVPTLLSSNHCYIGQRRSEISNNKTTATPLSANGSYNTFIPSHSNKSSRAQITRFRSLSCVALL